MELTYLGTRYLPTRSTGTAVAQTVSLRHSSSTVSDSRSPLMTIEVGKGA